MLCKNKKQTRQSRARLRDLLSENRDVYTQVTRVSRSGLSRDIRVFIVVQWADGPPTIENMTFHVAHAAGLDLRENKWGERVVRMCGGGIDVCFQIVSDLSMSLFDDGYLLKKQNL